MTKKKNNLSDDERKRPVDKETPDNIAMKPRTKARRTITTVDSESREKAELRLKHMRDRRFSPEGAATKMTQEQRERKRMINRLSAQRKRERERNQLDSLTDRQTRLKFLNTSLDTDNGRLEKLKKKLAAVSLQHPPAGMAPSQISLKIDCLENVKNAIKSFSMENMTQKTLEDASAAREAADVKKTDDPFFQTSEYLKKQIRLMDATEKVLGKAAAPRETVQRQNQPQGGNARDLPLLITAPQQPSALPTTTIAGPPPALLAAAAKNATSGTNEPALAHAIDESARQNLSRVLFSMDKAVIIPILINLLFESKSGKALIAAAAQSSGSAAAALHDLIQQTSSFSNPSQVVGGGFAVQRPPHQMNSSEQRNGIQELLRLLQPTGGAAQANTVPTPGSQIMIDGFTQIAGSISGASGQLDSNTLQHLSPQVQELLLSNQLGARRNPLGFATQGVSSNQQPEQGPLMQSQGGSNLSVGVLAQLQSLHQHPPSNNSMHPSPNLAVSQQTSQQTAPGIATILQQQQQQLSPDLLQQLIQSLQHSTNK